MAQNNEKIEFLDNLQKELDNFNKNIKKALSYKKDLNALLDIINQIQESWSGSWIGYHADLYYKNFERPPINERFDSEWGLQHRSQPNWEEKTYADVIRAIEKKYHGTSLNKIETSLNKIQKEDLHTSVCSDLSFIRTFDKFDKEIEILEEIENIKWKFSQGDIIRGLRPTHYATRDSLALSQGVKVPPHIQYEAKILSLLSLIKSIENFIKLTNRLIRQIRTRIFFKPETNLTNSSSINHSPSNVENKKGTIKWLIGLLIPSIIALNIVKGYFKGYDSIFFGITILLLIFIGILGSYCLYLHLSK
ncbi:hypothetical protein [Methanobacterium aggregans]|uniref:hypothetical protein n=1 Tax=Methanobacterium aggregans TaxID=1615586 RepID=UPI001AE80BEB|nr:hypothetical protein [Methanobacterium aggregans]MBP2045347.1 hypothetical protein [Methanobacterium aggregans]